MSLKRKTELLARQLFLSASLGVTPETELASAGQITLYRSQEAPRGRRLPAIVLDCKEAPPVRKTTYQEKRRLVVSALGTADQQTDADPEPAAPMGETVGAIFSVMRTESLADDLNALRAAAGVDNFTILFAIYVGPIEVDPIEGHFVESFAWDLVVIEANAD